MKFRFSVTTILFNIKIDIPRNTLQEQRGS